MRAVQQTHPLVQVDLAHVGDLAAQARLHLRLEVALLLGAPQLAREQQRHAGRARDLDRRDRALVDRHATEPEQVLAAGVRPAGMVVERDRVGNRRGPGQVGAGPAMAFRQRDERGAGRELADAPVERPRLTGERPVHRVQERRRP